MIQTGIVHALAACPKAPPGMDAYQGTITGWVQWAVLGLISIGVIVGIGAIVAGRVFSMPHASKVGIISIVVVFLCAVAYMVLPAMVHGITKC
ncbi:hypothetical protein FGL98_22290 [Leekyejoonella antrihumi]|uniref:Uncharacterized protein n=1 Tax=Leekyejoonella antrihumi TaxID=1660198 RepID=A0A563DT81_9MICO|nr:hypothetical protein FGL98_22290 [Leekyejoonella antrihumi]